MDDMRRSASFHWWQIPYCSEARATHENFSKFTSKTRVYLNILIFGLVKIF